VPSNPECPGDPLPSLKLTPTLPPAAREDVSETATLPPLAAFTDAAPGTVLHTPPLPPAPISSLAAVQYR
jgi:hypothetical protein